MNPENPNAPDPTPAQPGGLQENLELEEFFHRMPANFRWPKPTAEAVAAAVEAIQRMAGGPGPKDATAADGAEPGSACAGCGAGLLAGARFCSRCGLPAEGSGSDASPHAESRVGGQHHYHHHYHHFVPAQGTGAGASPAMPETAAPRGRISSSPGGSSSGGRAEVAARQVSQDWAQACNIKHLDDLLELYSSDATVIRPSLPPVRSLPAIRELLFSLLEAGLGDVGLESLRTEVMGDVAVNLGRCKMLVPVAMGKRREERGKYLMVLIRQSSGAWKILADCWCSDLVVSAPAAPETARKGSEPAGPARKVR